MRWGWFQEGRFLGKVLDEWIADSQEFLHTKLPHLIVIALIAFVLSRLLRLITFHMTRVAEQSGAGPGRLAEVKTLSGVIRATGLAIIGLIAGFRLSTHRLQSAPLLASAGIAGIAIGLAAQNIVKDMFNGFLILVEGQFSVGDTVRVAGVTGDRRSHDPAQNHSARRRRNPLRDSQLADHHRGQSQRGLLRGDDQRQRGFLRQSRCGDETAQRNRNGRAQQRRVQEHLSR